MMACVLQMRVRMTRSEDVEKQVVAWMAMNPGRKPSRAPPEYNPA